MSWEALTALGSVASAIVIAVSAVFAVQQLKELQRATQFDGTDRMLKEFYEPAQIAARRYVVCDLPAKLKDPAYRSTLSEAARSGPRAIDLESHPEINVLDYFERLGAYVSSGLLMSPTIFEIVFVFLHDNWQTLSDVITIARKAQDNPYLYVRTEELYSAGLRYAQRRIAKARRLRPSSGTVFTFDRPSRPSEPAREPPDAKP